MSLKVREHVCDACPFRRTAMPGWLGSNDPESFVDEAINGSRSIACHTMVNQELKRPEWLEAESKAPRCRGAITLMRNECKIPREPELAALAKSVPADRANVFSHRLEFNAFHNGAKHKSWESD